MTPKPAVRPTSITMAGGVFFPEATFSSFAVIPISVDVIERPPDLNRMLFLRYLVDDSPPVRLGLSTPM